MMQIVSLHIQFVMIFFVIVAIVQLLRRKGLFKDEYQEVFDRLVTEFALPVVIFSSLIGTTFRFEWIAHAAVFLLALAFSALAAYACCRLLRLPRKMTGALILVATFGSTSTLATPFISALYGAESLAVAEGLVQGLIAIAIPASTVGVLIAAYFGTDAGTSRDDLLVAVKKFLFTPIFIAFAIGFIVSLLMSFFHLEGAGIFAGVFEGFFEVIRQSLELLVWIAIGLMLRPLKARTFLPLLGIVVLVKMVLQPALVLAGASAAGFPALSHDILLIEAAMPSGAIAAVIADRYGCDGQIAAAVVIATYLISLATFPLIALMI